MKLRIKLSIALWCGFIFFGMAQEGTPAVKEVLHKAQEAFEQSPNFKTTLGYRLYRGKENPITIQEYDGLLAKVGNDMYLNINNTEIVIVGNEYIKINHDQKAIEYMDQYRQSEKLNPLNIEQYLTYFSDKKVEETNSSWLCELQTPKFTQLPYGSIVFEVDKTTKQLTKQTLMLVAPRSIKDEKGRVNNDPKFLEIEIKDFDTNASVKSLLSLQKFVTRNNDGISVSKEFASYQFINRTIQ